MIELTSWIDNYADFAQTPHADCITTVHCVVVRYTYVATVPAVGHCAEVLAKVADAKHETGVVKVKFRTFKSSRHIEMVATPKSVTSSQKIRLCRSDGIWERAQHENRGLVTERKR